jgi:hypothetical protein
MTGKRWKRKVAWLTAVSALLAVGCSGQPFEYHSQNEIPEGPGIFSGKDGAFTLGGGDAQSEPDAEAAQAAEATEFETFQRWKNDPRNAAEYQEFLEWRVWNANRDLQEHTQGQ